MANFCNKVGIVESKWKWVITTFLHPQIKYYEELSVEQSFSSKNRAIKQMKVVLSSLG